MELISTLLGVLITFIIAIGLLNAFIWLVKRYLTNRESSNNSGYTSFLLKASMLIVPGGVLAALDSNQAPEDKVITGILAIVIAYFIVSVAYVLYKVVMKLIHKSKIVKKSD